MAGDPSGGDRSSLRTGAGALARAWRSSSLAKKAIVVLLGPALLAAVVSLRGSGRSAARTVDAACRSACRSVDGTTVVDAASCFFVGGGAGAGERRCDERSAGTGRQRRGRRNRHGRYSRR